MSHDLSGSLEFTVNLHILSPVILMAVLEVVLFTPFWGEKWRLRKDELLAYVPTPVRGSLRLQQGWGDPRSAALLPDAAREGGLISPTWQTPADAVPTPQDPTWSTGSLNQHVPGTEPGRGHRNG